MKADTFPTTPRLDIPSWVPGAIAQYVSAEYAAAVDRIYREALRESESGYFEHGVPDEHLDDLVCDDGVRASIADLVRDELVDITERYLPLACDRRMEGVWRELSRHRSNGAFLYPAIGIEHDAAMLELFKAAFACQKWPGATTTQRQAEQQRDRYLAKADELWDDAITMLVQPGVAYNKYPERYRKLQDAAQAYKDYANEVYATTCATALERRHDGQGRWVALTIGDKFRALFGKPMYGLTATITSVVLGREIEPRRVQQWLAYPAVKPPKIAP